MRALTFLLLASAALTQPLRFEGYRVYFDPAPQGRRATWANIVPDGRRLDMVFTDFIEDDEAGALPYLVSTRDGGLTWSAPEPFGLDFMKTLADPAKASSSLGIAGPTSRGTVLAVGYHVPKGATKESYQEDIRFRASSLIVGRREKGANRFTFRAYPTGTFLGEQFGYGGLFLSAGRTILQVWGAARDGSNWECGVLISDDDARTWRYRRVAFEPALEIRDRPRSPAGYNEQTLFELRDGTLVSMIRGRDKLGRVPSSPRDTWYFRSESRDRGETWSEPEPSNLAGTGAPPSGITLPDGSILMASRIPYSRELYPVPDKEAFGLHIARSTDGGRNWRTEWLQQRDPDGRAFDNYYNAMNGQFLRTARNLWIYAFPQFSVKHRIHRVLAVTVSAPGE
jgi:hypothetical protein